MTKRHPPASRELMTADEAASALGISRRTLYSYVSRGLIGVRGKSIGSRGSLYDTADVDLLRERKKRGRSHAAIAASTLRFGEPVLESGLTNIEQGRFGYRGHDAMMLSEAKALEEVADLLWSMPPPDAADVDVPAPATTPDCLDRCINVISGAVHLGKSDANPRATRADATKLMYMVAQAAGGASRWPAAHHVHEGLARTWGVDAAGADLLRRCLILAADHELSAATYAARIAASTGASLGACLLAALCTFSGPFHAGAINTVRAFLSDREVLRSPTQWADRFRKGAESPRMIAGFGHRLYPDGDPRAAALLRFVALDPEWQVLAASVRTAIGLLPSFDFALVAVERHLRLPPFAATALIITGRSVGWIAHVLEQRSEKKLIRPRAVYRERPTTA